MKLAMSQILSTRLLNGNRKCDSEGIASSSEYQVTLERERARAERYGNMFSLVIFQFGKMNREVAGILERIAFNTRRSIDQLGWIDASQLAAVLPETDGRGAKKFAEKVCKAIEKNSAPPGFRVIVYPGSQTCDYSSEKKNVNRTQDYVSLMKEAGPFMSTKMHIWKRCIDIIGSLFALFLSWPIFLILAVFIKCVSQGPVFFKQPRLGYLGSLFTIWKFRTMNVDADGTLHQLYLNKLMNAEEPMTKLDDKADQRIIPFGRFLRQSGLDELPQLFNILCGQMSLVGPRPCTIYEAQEYELWQSRRFDTKPGLTGLWQVSGKNRTNFKEMIRLDVQYVEKGSFWLDIKIILKTLPTILAEISASNTKSFLGKEREYGEQN